jgi:hypothetical protein
MLTATRKSVIPAKQGKQGDPLRWYGLDKNGDMTLRNCIEDWIDLWCTDDVDTGVRPGTPPLEEQASSVPVASSIATATSSPATAAVAAAAAPSRPTVEVEDETEEADETDNTHNENTSDDIYPPPELVDAPVNPNATNVLTSEIKFRALRALIFKCVKTSEFAEDLVYMTMQYLNKQIAELYPDVPLIPIVGSEETIVSRCCEFMTAYDQRLFDDLERADYGNRYVNLHAFVYKYFQIPIFHQHLAFIICHRLRDLGYITHSSSFACSVLGERMHPHWRRRFIFNLSIKTAEDAKSIQDVMRTNLLAYDKQDVNRWHYDAKRWRCARSNITITNRSELQPIAIVKRTAKETKVWNTPAKKTNKHEGLGDILDCETFELSAWPATLRIDIHLHRCEFPHMDEFRHAIESYEARTP